MARKPRLYRPGTVFHLISRFVDRNWFIIESCERERYVKLLGRGLSMSDWRCLAYAVMSNHIHLCAVAGMQKLDTWIRRVHSPFADWMNRKYARIGPMFVRGPKDYAIPPERVARVLAYIHNNPVRAGVVDHPSASAWTSHQSYLGIAPTPAWLHVAEGLRRAGFEDAAAFDRFVARSPQDVDIDELLARDFERADDDDVAESCVAHLAAGHLTAAAKDPIAIVRSTAETIGIPVAQLTSRKRGKLEVLGRQIAVACAQRVGLTGTDIARALNITQAGASLIARRAPPPAELVDAVLAVLGSDISCSTTGRLANLSTEEPAGALASAHSGQREQVMQVMSDPSKLTTWPTRSDVSPCSDASCTAPIPAALTLDRARADRPRER